MKRKLSGIRVIGGICAAFCWWGLLYPELTMTPDTYEVFCEDEAVIPHNDMIEWDSEEDIYRMILETEGGRIRFKSRLLEYLKLSEESNESEKCTDWRF